MADKQGFDPVAAWQQMVGQWERQVNDLSAQVSGNPMFAGPLNEVAKVTMRARKSMDGTMEQMATAMMLATQTQMHAVIERLDRIEEQIGALAAHLEAGAGGAVPPPAPARTRKPPAPAA